MRIKNIIILFETTLTSTNTLTTVLLHEIEIDIICEVFAQKPWSQYLRSLPIVMNQNDFCRSKRI